MKKQQKRFSVLLSIFGLFSNSLFSQITEKSYAKFDFIPGDIVLFEDDFRGEITDEIPSQWIVSSGKVEVVRINGELVMGFLDGSPEAYPRQKNKNEYPERITLEFDYLWRNNNKTWEQAWKDGNTAGGDLIKIRFAKDKDYYESQEAQKMLGDFMEDLWIKSGGEVKFGNFEGSYSLGEKIPGTEGLFKDLSDKWVHVSIAITERSLKVYLNSERILNASISEGKILTFQISSTSNTMDYGAQAFIKNVRIAEGGADPYKQLMNEGRIIARGINFDSGKSTLKPESMGTLNSIYKILKENPELKLEVSGHTDSDGEETMNLNLSQARAESVREKLIELGIDGQRLTSKGYGETMPINPNLTPEQKANNRRVEFVRI